MRKYLYLFDLTINIMKRFSILVATLAICCTMSAQHHMTFKGVEINGTTPEMVNKLVSAGFEDLGKSENNDLHYLKGNFAGYDAIIAVVPTVSGVAHSVAVEYREGLLNWTLAIERFNDLEKNLTKKYGDPTVVKKDISGFSDGTTLIRNNKGKWSTSWYLAKGKISLSVFVTQSYDLHIHLVYTDKINKLAAEQQAYDDL